MKKKRGLKKRLGHKSWLTTILCLLYSSIIVLLLYITVISSFKDGTAIVTDIFALPESLDFSHYVEVITESHFLRSMWNSIFITGVSIVGLLFVSSMLAYGYARYDFKGKGFLQTFILLGMMFPIQLGVLINFRTINALGLVNTPWGLILIYIGNLSLATFLFMRFFTKLPESLAESAKIDGANEFTIFAKIMMPLSKPIFGTVALVSGLTIYNDFYMPLIFLGGEQRTATVVLQGNLSAFLFNIEKIFPMVVISVIPVILMYLFCQKQLIEGLTAGAEKT